MHAAFVNPGGPLVPDLAKAKRYGITRLYWQANDKQLTPAILQGIRNQGMQVGILRGPEWTNASAVDLARELDADLVRLGGDAQQCAVLADIEAHDPAYVIEFLHEWRLLRPRRVTGWTLEPNQGGWFTNDLRLFVISSNVTVYPQAYYGDMAPTDVDATRCDLIERGILRGMVSAFYSALHLPPHWDGIVFRFDQLP